MAALVVGDAVAILVGYLAVMYFIGALRPGSALELLVDVVAVVASGLLVMRSQHLWVDRIIAVRAIELSRLARAVVLLGLATIVLDRAIKLYIHVEDIFIGCATVMVALVAWRSVYRTWLATQRKSGNFQRRMLIVGTDRRAVDLVRLFRTHPEAGVVVVGLIGSAREARMAGLSDLWLANSTDAGDVLADADVEAVVLCSSDINPALLDVLIRDERSRHRDLYLDPGMGGIDFRRVQALPIAHQPLLYVEAPSLSRLELGAKRAFDITVAAAMLVVLSPVLALVAALIKLEDRGPVLFRQQRVGRGGGEFGMIKFRSMCIDAEARLAALQADNERSGPLFKLDGHDPRVTRIGRFLRSTQPRRAAAAVQRAARRHEPRRPAAGAGVRGGGVPGGAAGPSPGPPRHHRALAGRSAGQPVVRRLPPPRHLLRRELVVGPRPHHLARHHRPGAAATDRDSPPAGPRAGVGCTQGGVISAHVSASDAGRVGLVVNTGGDLA